jgi:hypothetical protein
MIRKRRVAGLCTCCDKKNYDVKFCVDRVNITIAVASLWKVNSGQVGVGSVFLVAKASKPLVVRVFRPRTQEIEDLDFDMD